MPLPLISVIVTTFNRPALLMETLRSLCRQTYPRFEILVVDNYSSVDIGELLKSLQEKRIRFFKNENRGIIAVNRNEGIRQARGEMLAFCDDDDLWVPHKLERQWAMFDPVRHVGIGSSLRIHGGGAFYRRESLLKGGDRGMAELMTEGAPPLSSLMVAQTGLLFSENERFKNVEDFEFQLRLVNQTHKRIAIVETPLIHYRIHANNYNRDRAQRLNGIRVLREYKNQVSSASYGKALARQYFLAGMASLRCGDQNATMFFRRAIVLNPRDSLKQRLGYGVSCLPVFLWGIAIFLLYGMGNMSRAVNPFSKKGK